MIEYPQVTSHTVCCLLSREHETLNILLKTNWLRREEMYTMEKKIFRKKKYQTWVLEKKERKKKMKKNNIDPNRVAYF